MKFLYIISALSLLTSFNLFAQSDGDELFNDSYLHEVRFENADTNIFIDSKNYQQLKMTIDGNLVDSVGFKRKGNISGYGAPYNKHGIKIKTNKYVANKEYDGIKEFTFHMNYQDPSMMREKITYDICNEMGLYSLRTAFAKVYINDVYWGLYTLVEGKDEMYKQRFDNRDMDAIESLDFGDMCYISDNPDDYNYEITDFPYYKFENGDPATVWPRFATLIDKANNTPDDDYLSIVPDYFNIEDFFIYQAINVYLLNFDSYIGFRGNQIYVYDVTTNRWEVTPWDFNASFGLWDTDAESPETYPLIPDNISGGCIAGKMGDIEELEAYYLNSMCILNNTVWDTITAFNQIDIWYDQIKEAVYEDTRKVITNTDFDNSVGNGYYSLFGENIPAMKTFARERYLFIYQALNDLGYDCSSIGLGIDEDQEASVVNIYPNPSSNQIHITGLNEWERITVYNLLGEVVLESLDQENIDVSNLVSGTYLVKIKVNDDEIITKKLVRN